MKQSTGFTLVELMVTVAVIAILASIAYPSYTSQVAKSRRADAQQFMMQMDTRQKQILIEQRAYATTPDALNVSSEGFTCNSSRCANSFYNITFNPAVDNTATPPSYNPLRHSSGCAGQRWRADADQHGNETKANRNNQLRRRNRWHLVNHGPKKLRLHPY